MRDANDMRRQLVRGVSVGGTVLAVVLAVVAVGSQTAVAASGTEEAGATEPPPKGGADEAELKRRLRQLEAKYQETGNAKYLFERVLTLEEMGEYDFALQVLRENRAAFESHPEVDGVAVVEQRLIDGADASEDGGGRHDSEGSGSSGGGGRSRDTGGTDVLGIVLTGAGALAITGGVVELVVAETRAKELRCSPEGEGPSSEGCGGVDIVRFDSKSEFQEAQTKVRTRRIVGASLSVVGAGLAGYGIYRLVSQGSGDERAASLDGLGAPRIAAGPTAGGGAAFRLEFDF